MEDKLLRYTLRIDRILFRKFRYIAGSEGRSANKDIEQYIKRRFPITKGKTAKSPVWTLKRIDRKEKL